MARYRSSPPRDRYGQRKSGWEQTTAGWRRFDPVGDALMTFVTVFCVLGTLTGFVLLCVGVSQIIGLATHTS